MLFQLLCLLSQTPASMICCAFFYGLIGPQHLRSCERSSARLAQHSSFWMVPRLERLHKVAIFSRKSGFVSWQSRAAGLHVPDCLLGRSHDDDNSARLLRSQQSAIVYDVWRCYKFSLASLSSCRVHSSPCRHVTGRRRHIYFYTIRFCTQQYNNTVDYTVRRPPYHLSDLGCNSATP